MGKVQKRHSQPVKVTKHIRFMEVGLAHILAMPVAIMLMAMYGLGRFAAQIAVLLVMAGVIWFAIGWTGRQEAKQREDGN